MLLAAGQARIIHEATGHKVRIGNPDSGNVKWFELYDYIPYLSREGIWWKDHKGFRGYMSHYTTIPDGRILQLFYNMQYRAVPAVIDIDAEPNDYIIIEPSKKDTAPSAKLWHGYQELVDRFDGKFVQLNQDTLDGVERLDTTLTEAARLMKGCRAYVGTEGFLHHLAAAFDKPAVVLMGAFVPPTVLGYPGQINLCVDDPRELGHCAHVGAMSLIPVEAVVTALDDALSGNVSRHTIALKRGNYVIQGFDIRYFG